eukprot:scaffold1325_cov95-Cylindrotheca_fusiformis.AAC.5
MASKTGVTRTTATDVLGIPRGGGSRNGDNKNGKKLRKGSPPRSFLGWREKVGSMIEGVEDFTERKTFFSRELMPQSEPDAEWAAFLKGWLLVSLPIPLPLMFVALVAYSTLMSFSQWDDAIKRKFIIGLYHGVLVFAVLLQELHEKVDAVTRPRQMLILINVATNLFLGKTGRFKATKFLMDSSTFGTLFYILYQYFDTPNFGDTAGKSWYRKQQQEKREEVMWTFTELTQARLRGSCRSAHMDCWIGKWIPHE